MKDTRTKKSPRETWKTIDYIGGGFVLQKRMQARVEKRIEYSYRKEEYDFKEAEVTEVVPKYDFDISIRESPQGNDGTVTDIHQKHRVVHITELGGIDGAEMLEKVEERGELK
jgi:hypothetical protein